MRREVMIVVGILWGRLAWPGVWTHKTAQPFDIAPWQSSENFALENCTIELLEASHSVVSMFPISCWATFLDFLGSMKPSGYRRDVFARERMTTNSFLKIWVPRDSPTSLRCHSPTCPQGMVWPASSVLPWPLISQQPSGLGKPDGAQLQWYSPLAQWIP